MDINETGQLSVSMNWYGGEQLVMGKEGRTKATCWTPPAWRHLQTMSLPVCWNTNLFNISTMVNPML